MNMTSHLHKGPPSNSPSGKLLLVTSGTGKARMVNLKDAVAMLASFFSSGPLWPRDTGQEYVCLT